MSFKMMYENEYEDSGNLKAMVEVNDDITLSNLFARFIDMTRIMGFHADSWETIIDDMYGSCVLHVDAAEDYNAYDWAQDVEDGFNDIFAARYCYSK